MKCANCGAELKVGCIYCSVCGKEAQIVSDYNLLEDDFLRDMLKEKEKKAPGKTAGEVSEKQTRGKKAQKSGKDGNPKRGKGNRKPKKRLIFAVAAILLLIVLVVGIVLLVNHSMDHSYDYQIQQAEKCQDSRDYRKAERYAKRALELDEDSTEAKLLLADIYLLQEETDQAVEILMQMCREQKDNAAAYQKLIQIYEEQKDYESIRALSEDVEDADILELFSDYLPEMPEFDTAEGVYPEPIRVELLAEEDCSIYYTVDGTDPKRGREYQEPVLVEPGQKVQIRAIACNSYGIYSEEIEGNFQVELQKPEVPKVTPDGGSFYTPQTISVEVPEGCKVYYTWDGTVPDAGSQRYTQPIDMPEGNNILSLVLIDQYGMSSDVLKCNYIYMP